MKRTDVAEGRERFEGWRPIHAHAIVGGTQGQRGVPKKRARGGKKRDSFKAQVLGGGGRGVVSRQNQWGGPLQEWGKPSQPAKDCTIHLGKKRGLFGKRIRLKKILSLTCPLPKEKNFSS